MIKARENANLKKEEFLFSKNKKRKTTEKEEMGTYGLAITTNRHKCKRSFAIEESEDEEIWIQSTSRNKEKKRT